MDQRSINDSTLIVNSSEIKGNYLLNSFITEFDSDFSIIKNIRVIKQIFQKNGLCMMQEYIKK